jgi:hypothetical protein
VAIRQHDESIRVVGEKYVAANQERTSLLMSKRCESRLELARAARIQNRQTHPEHTRRCLQFSRFGPDNNRVG